jgi:hypothetical protein
VRLALAGLGVAPDIVEIILKKALAAVGADDPIALTGVALGQLQGLSLVPNKTMEMKKAQASSRARKPTPDLAPDDLRALVAQGQEQGQSAYEALSKAGVIVPIDQLYRVS